LRQIAVSGFEVRPLRIAWPRRGIGKIVLRSLNAFDQRVGHGEALGYRVIEQFDSVSNLVHEALLGFSVGYNGYNAGIIGHSSPFPGFLPV
jgi:hypothetical protein